MLYTINLIWLANFVICHRVWKKWKRLELYEKEKRGITVHHRDAVSFQYLAFTWVHQRSLSVIQLTLGGIRHDQSIVLMKATGAIKVAPVWNHPTSHRTLRVGPVEGRSAASPRLDHTLVTPETNGSQPANEVKLFICDVIGNALKCLITLGGRMGYGRMGYEGAVLV